MSSPRPVLLLEQVGLQIPVFSTETRSLKAALIRSVTGGQLKRGRSGAVMRFRICGLSFDARRPINCSLRADGG